MLGSDNGGSSSDEGIVDHIAFFPVIPDGAAHAFHRFLGAVLGVGIFRFTAEWIAVFYFPKGALGPIPAPLRFLSLAHGIPERLVLPVIGPTTKNEVLFPPDDLGPDE